MKNKDIILNMMNHNLGIITTKEVDEIGISRKTLTRMVNENLIQRVSQGLYVLPATWGDEYYNLTYSSKKACFSHATALYFHDLSEKVPLTYDITVEVGYNGGLRNNHNVNLYYVKPEIFELGKIEMKSPQGKTITVYDIERCLCDILKHKSKMDIEIVKYAFKTYIKSSHKNLFKLSKYAKELNVEREVNNYLEVLL